MNLDIRNIDNEFERAIEKIKNTSGITTAAKAVKYATVNHCNYIKTMKEQREEITALQTSIDALIRERNQIVYALEILNGYSREKKR